MFLTALTCFWQLYVNLAWTAIEEQKWEHELCFSMNCEFLVRREEIIDKFLLLKLSCAAVWSYVIASYFGSNRIFKIFKSKWSNDKMLIGWVRSGRLGKYLALGQRSVPCVRPDLEPNIFTVRPSHSVNNNLLLTEHKGCTGEYWHEVVTVRTEHREVRTKTTEGKYFPVRLEQAKG